MTLKEWAMRRIEKDAVISELNGKKVILKKSKIPVIGGEWKEIHPPVDVNGNVNYLNLIFGGWRNFLLILIILLIVGMYMFQYFDALNYIKYLKDNPCIQNCINNVIG